MSGQAQNAPKAPSTRWRGPKYILLHTDVLMNDKHVFCECQYLYILRQKITITLTFIKTLGYRFHGSRTTLTLTPTQLAICVPVSHITAAWPSCQKSRASNMVCGVLR